ncbi:MAG TPA: hypothetical protein VF401_04655 [Candidatus Saccharimonadales bacterium]
MSLRGNVLVGAVTASSALLGAFGGYEQGRHDESVRINAAATRQHQDERNIQLVEQRSRVGQNVAILLHDNEQAVQVQRSTLSASQQRDLGIDAVSFSSGQDRNKSTPSSSIVAGTADALVTLPNLRALKSDAKGQAAKASNGDTATVITETLVVGGAVGVLTFIMADVARGNRQRRREEAARRPAILAGADDF